MVESSHSATPKS